MKPTRTTAEVRPLLTADSHLARLVQRVHPNEAALQRRQPSMFEPGQGGGLADHGDAAVDAAPPASSPPRPRSEPVAATPSPPPRSRTATEAASPATIAPIAPIAHQELRVLRETLRIDASLRTPALPVPQPATAAAAPETGHTTQARQVEHVSAQARASLERVRVEPVVRREAERLRAEPAAPRRPGLRESPGVSPHPAPAAITPAPLLHPAHAASQPAATTVPRAAQRATALQALRRQPVASAASPRELPPVQVTIGRVEVRAVTAPPAASERRARAAPRLSLEQYLHERQRGGR